jgi:hypothetical protein
VPFSKDCSQPVVLGAASKSSPDRQPAFGTRELALAMPA